MHLASIVLCAETYGHVLQNESREQWEQTQCNSALVLVFSLFRFFQYCDVNAKAELVLYFSPNSRLMIQRSVLDF